MAKASFSLSGLVHGTILAWLIAGDGERGEPKLSIYDMQIHPYESRIVWYPAKERLPDISPSAEKRNPAPPRAKILHRQTLSAGAQDAPLAQRVWLPDTPDLPKQKLPPLPNALAIAAKAPARSLRPFTPPPAETKAAPLVPVLPDVPQASSLPAQSLKPLNNPPVKVPPRQFTMPTEHRAAPVPASLPDAPQVALAVNLSDAALPGGPLRTPPKTYIPPAPQTRAPAAAALPDAPYLPSLTPAEATLAIAGLAPAPLREIPKPTVSHDAAFSAGPELKPKGGDGVSNGGIIVVPGLLARGGEAPDPTMAGRAALRQTNLVAGVRPPISRPPAAAPPPPPGTRVSEAPDPRLAGRTVYSLAIQMPNVTSYSGSWFVWFAERGPGGDAAGLQSPNTLHKVDPKYIASAVSERVEGTVRLYAIIRKDGRVDSVSVVRHLDDRLDQSATEALSKWQFEPAIRAGAAVEVDAIFEIPFRLAPRAAR